jgi:hypothetical protein
MRGRGGFIGSNVTPASAAVNSAASGVWSVREAESLKRAGTWPTAFVNPTSITGLQLWLDASDSGTLYNATSGGSLVAADGSVARWEDKSGNARHATQSTAGNRPVRKTAIQNGLDVLRFDGTDDFLDSTDFLDLTSGQAMTAFVVLKRASTGGNHQILSKYGFSNANDDSTQKGWNWMFLSTDRIRANFTSVANDGFSTRLSDSTVTASSFTVLALKSSAGSLSSSMLYRNSSVVASSATAADMETLSDTTYAITIGALRYTFNSAADKYLQFANADYAEVIIYNSALSDANRAAVESYLIGKWGIS